jgi:hypothetical protein
MHQAGFEPAHPEIVGLKSTALDHSAIGASFFCILLITHTRALAPPPSQIHFFFDLHFLFCFTFFYRMENK